MGYCNLIAQLAPNPLFKRIETEKQILMPT